jgi:hypothetical protein
MPLTRLILLMICISISSSWVVYSQPLKGRITDEKTFPIPFAVVYDETTYTGVTSNADGYYDLRLEPGIHSIVYKAMGYFLMRKSVEITDKEVILDVILAEQPVAVKEVIITPGKEDPAYAIMRKAIGLAPYHLNQVKEYQAEVYLRGTAHIIKIPKFISKHTAVSVNDKTAQIKSGDVFLEESVNQINFHAPDKYEQKVTFIHSTFPWNSEDINPMGIVNSSLYEPDMEDFISPLAPNAFNFYTYRYEGFFDEGNKVVFKIKVTPKRNSQQLMRGYIYVVDKLWCLHSADVSVDMFFGSIGYKVIYASVKSEVWLPVSYLFNVDASIMGIKAVFKYNSSVKFRQVVLNEKVAKVSDRSVEPQVPEKTPVQSKSAAKVIKQQQDMENLLTKEDLSNRDMVKLATLMARETHADTAKTRSLEIQDGENKVIVEKDAIRNDTAFWNTIRPIPLSSIEAKITGIKDSALIALKDSTSVSDTVGKREKSKISGKLGEFVLSGAGFWMFDSTLHIRYNGLFGLKKFDFNTVDGFIYRQTISLEQTIDSLHKLKVSPGIAFAFNRQRWMWWTDINYNYAPMRGGRLDFHIGSLSADYNGESGINSSINSLASLFFRRNYMKLYQQNIASITNKIDLANGLNLSATFGFRSARLLENHSDYSFFYRNEREYSPNLPDIQPEWISRNLNNDEAYWDMQLEFTPRYYYKLGGGSKHYQHSKFPTLIVRNKMAVPGIINSKADFDLLEIGIKQHMEWGMMHEFSWNIKGGFFLNRNLIYTMDDKYFNNQYLPVLINNSSEAFRLLPYYRSNTNSKYVEAHVTFTTPYLLIKYLPFLNNKIWCENLHLNYLTTKDHPDYWEVGYSISQIYMMGSVGVFVGFGGTTFKSYGVQVSFDL